MAVVMVDSKTLEDCRIRLLQYDNLRKLFSQLIDDVLGTNYYNMGMDVYTCDELTCKDLKDRLCKRDCLIRRNQC